MNAKTVELLKGCRLVVQAYLELQEEMQRLVMTVGVARNDSALHTIHCLLADIDAAIQEAEK